MSKKTEKQSLLEEAKRLGIPANTKWTMDRLRSAINEKKAQPSTRDTLIQSATELGIFVPEEWSEENIQEALDAYHEAEQEPQIVNDPQVRISRPRRRRNSPRG